MSVAVFRITLQKKAAVPLDDGQQVIEIVRHARGQLPDCLHTLSFRQALMKRLLLGNIQQNAVQQWAAFRSWNEGPAVIHPAQFAVASKQTIFRAERPSFESVLFSAPHHLTIRSE